MGGSVCVIEFELRRFDLPLPHPERNRTSRYARVRAVESEAEISREGGREIQRAGSFSRA